MQPNQASFVFPLHFWSVPIRMAIAYCALALPSGFSQNVLTQAYDNSRSGANTSETILAPSTVAAGFGELFERAVDGDVQAQVLYLRNVSVPGQTSPKNLFFAATAKNKLYAFDADSTDPTPTGGLIWSRQINSTRELVIGSSTTSSEICNETFDGFVGITSTPVIDPTSNTLYAVSWRPGLADMNLFTASATGAVQMSGWLGSSIGYHPWSAVSPDSFVTPKQPVTALWRDANHLDLFTISSDGGIYNAWWEAEKGAQSWQWSRIGSAGIAVPGQRVSALWITPTQLDLFFVAADGTVETTSWQASGGWQNWSAIGPAGAAAPGQPVSTAVRGAHIDVFITSPNGTVETTWWEATPGWQSWSAIGEPVDAVPGSEVTVLPNGTAHLDLFITSASGTVKTTWWEPTPGWHPWFSIGPAANAPAGATVTALWNGLTHMDIFVTGPDGSVRTTWWEPAPSWNPWFTAGAAGTAAPGGIVSALWHLGTHLDIFVAASDGTVETAWWEMTRGWQPWSAIGPAGTTQPLEPLSAVWALPSHVTDTGGNYVHAIDVTTGLDKPFSPVKVQATAPDNSAAILDPRCHRNRPGLLLSNGVVYIGFSCLTCDRWCTPTSPFRGWVLGYNASNLSQVAVFSTSSAKAAAGIWQSGSGLAGDAAGNIYFQTGNGEPADATNAPPLGDSFVKLTPTSASPGLAFGGSFLPSNAQVLRCGDTDLGAGGPVLLPSGKLIGGGKEGKLYLIDASTMNANQQFQAFINTWHADPTQPPCSGPTTPWITCAPQPFPPIRPGASRFLLPAMSHLRAIRFGSPLVLTSMERRWCGRSRSRVMP